MAQEWKQVKLSEFLTDEEINLCMKVAETIQAGSTEYVDWVANGITGPNIDRINQKLGQENDPRYLAYAISWVMLAGRKP